MQHNQIERFHEAFDNLPTGSGTGHYLGRRYRYTKSEFVGGKSRKLVASELGGTDYISLNVLSTRSGTYLKPCEMPEQKVVDFVIGFAPEPEGTGA